MAGVLASNGALTIFTETPSEAADLLGAPARVELTLRPAGPDALDLVVSRRSKPANRMPEAGFLTFDPAGVLAWHTLKMGLWSPAQRVAPRGGGQLQAVSAIRGERPDRTCIEFAPLDTPLVAPTDAHFMRFSPIPPRFDAGVRFNLYNNKWGTNFPMWWSGDFDARFSLTVRSARPPWPAKPFRP